MTDTEKMERAVEVTLSAALGIIRKHRRGEPNPYFASAAAEEEILNLLKR